MLKMIDDRSGSFHGELDAATKVYPASTHPSSRDFALSIGLEGVGVGATSMTPGITATPG